MFSGHHDQLRYAAGVDLDLGQFGFGFGDVGGFGDGVGVVIDHVADPQTRFVAFDDGADGGAHVDQGFGDGVGRMERGDVGPDGNVRRWRFGESPR